MSNFNDYSPALKQILEDARPKEGEARTFESIRKRVKVVNGKRTIQWPNSIKVSAVDSIKDPGTGDIIRIAFIDGVDINTDIHNGTAVRERLGKISIRGGMSQGKITIHGDNPSQMALFDYLFLTNQNAGNAGKPWYTGKGSKHLFSMKQPALTAAQKNKRDRLIRKAKAVVDDMSAEVAKATYHKLNIKQGLLSSSDAEEYKAALYKYCENNPQMLLDFSDNFDGEFDIFVRKLVDKKVVAIKKMKWMTTDDEEELLKLTPANKEKQIERLKQFLGEDENLHILEMLESKLTETA